MRLNLARILAVGLASMLAGCQLVQPKPPEPEPPPAPPPIESPLATHEFEFDPEIDQVIGDLQVTHVQGEDTLSDIARRFNLGYEEVLRANPGVDPWLPGEGREIVLPTQFVLPNAPSEGGVVNVPAMRLAYFPAPAKTAAGKKVGSRTAAEQRTAPAKALVITRPIGIGKIGWAPPEGPTKILRRTKYPTWRVPVSVRREREKNGEPLPAVVPPGPDN